MAGARSFKKYGAKGADLETAWRDRLEDARTLIAAGRSAMAIANGLYALEIRLKVLVCERLDLTSLPRPFEVHDLEELLVLTGLSTRMANSEMTTVKLNWDNVILLSRDLNDLRYMPQDRWPIEQARIFMGWLDDSEHGVLKWLDNGR